MFIQQNQQLRELISAHSKDVTQTQQQRPESPTVTPTWHASKYKVLLHKLHQRYILKKGLVGSVLLYVHRDHKHYQGREARDSHLDFQKYLNKGNGLNI